MTKRRPNWAPPPLTPAGTLSVPLQVLPTEQLAMWVLSKNIVGVVTHYDGSRTLPCTKEVLEDGEIVPCWCSECDRKGRWQGWLSVARVRIIEVRLVCITPSVIAANRHVLKTDDLRGWRLDLKRSTKSPTSRMMGAFYQENHVPALPPPCDVHRALERMWEAPLRSVPLRKTLPPGGESEQGEADHNQIPTGEGE